MLLRYHDFNGANQLLTGALAPQWLELENVLNELAVHLKPSEQEGIEGRVNFDPVWTNIAIKEALRAKGWGINIPIPEEFSFLGTDVDFFRGGLLVEAQFSNYPFLLNNIVRTALFAKSRTLFTDNHVEAIVIIAKAHMLPASNSMLYYEQAISQLTAFTKFEVFNVPIRVVGLFVPIGVPTDAVWSEYSTRGRKPLKQEHVTCTFTAGKRTTSTCVATISRMGG